MGAEHQASATTGMVPPHMDEASAFATQPTRERTAIRPAWTLPLVNDRDASQRVRRLFPGVFTAVFGLDTLR